MTAETPLALFRHRIRIRPPQYDGRTTRRNLHCAGCFTKWHSLCNGNQTFYRGMEVAVTFPYTKLYGGPAPEQLGTVVRVSAPSEGKIAVVIRFALGMSERAASASALNSHQVPDSLGAGEPRKRPLILVNNASDATKY